VTRGAGIPTLIACLVAGTISSLSALRSENEPPAPQEISPAQAKGDEDAPAREALEAGEALWEQRECEESLRKAIRIYEEQFEKDPSLALCSRLCRAYYLLADVFLQDDVEAKIDVHWQGASCALEGLKLQEDFRKALRGRWPSGKAIALVDEEHVEALMWWVAHAGRWLLGRNMLTQLKHRGSVIAALERIEELDDQVLAGSLYRAWGLYYTHRGKMEQARENFERAIQIAPPLLLTRTMYAEECAVRARDRELFVEQLTLALEEPEPDIPEILPEFRLYRARAEALLARTDELFPE